MSPALILVILILAVLGLAALVIALFRASSRGKQAPPVWPLVAERLDPGAKAVVVPAGDGALAGRCLGFEVEVRVETPSRERRRVAVRVGLAPPLGLGIVLGSESRPREPAPDGASPFATGNPALDRGLDPRARDPRGARRLFERKILRDRLEAALRRWPLVAVTDEALTLGGEHPLAEPPPLDDLLADAAAIARLLGEDRQRPQG
jgi:hypothetical protein